MRVCVCVCAAVHVVAIPAAAADIVVVVSTHVCVCVYVRSRHTRHHHKHRRVRRGGGFKGSTHAHAHAPNESSWRYAPRSAYTHVSVAAHDTWGICTVRVYMTHTDTCAVVVVVCGCDGGVVGVWCSVVRGCGGGCRCIYETHTDDVIYVCVRVCGCVHRVVLVGG